MKFIPTSLLGMFVLLLSANCFGQFGFLYNDSITVKAPDTLSLAWAGGINNAQFSEIDYDFDGDMDLFIFDRSSNNIRVFSQEDNAGVKYYKYVYNAKDYFPADLRYRCALVDYNNDGKNDIFTYSVGGLAVYRNVGDISNGLQWVLEEAIVESLLPSGMSNLYVSSSDIPAIVDVDFDGDIDVLTFHQGGLHVEYHQNQSMDLYGIPDSLIFELKNECWGKFSEDVTTNGIILNDPNAPCVGGNIPFPEGQSNDNVMRSSGHSGSSLLALDYDASGVLDLILGDVSYTNLNLLINGGAAVNTDSPMISNDPAFPSTTTPVDLQIFPASFYVDVDFDGIKDILVTPNVKNSGKNVQSVLYYRNLGMNNSPNLVFMGKAFLQEDMIEHGKGSIPVLFDVNEDGLKDLVVANFYRYKDVLDKESTIAYYLNDGTPTEPSFNFVEADYLTLSMELFGLRSVPTFGDMDGDNDEDLLLGVEDGSIVYYENISTGGGAVFAPPMAYYADYTGNPIQVGAFAHPQLVDLNNDNLLDLVVGNKTGEIAYYENIGTVNNPLFELINPMLGNVDVSTTTPDGYAAPHFFKVGNEMHLFCGSINGELIYYDSIDGNLASGQSFNLVSSSYLDINVETYSSFFVDDIDQDGNLNMFVGQDLGGLFHFEADSTSNVSVEELNMVVDVAIYPNPTEDVINIQSEHPLKKYFLLDSKGSVLKVNDIHASLTQVDVSELPKGLYFVQIVTENGQTCVKKLIKR